MGIGGEFIDPKTGRQTKIGITSDLFSGIFLIIGYLLLAGVIGWSTQMLWLTAIIALIWWFSR